MDEHLEIEPETKTKKIFIFIISIFLLLITLSYFLVGPRVYHVIAGQIESTPIKENLLQINNLAIKFTDVSFNQLQQIYNQNKKTEFSLCLIGTKTNLTYHINSLYEPKSYRKTFNHVSFEPCSSETLIMLHSHPYKSCIASKTDLNTLKKTKAINPNILMLVMCEPGRFSIYE